jgi:hypothetical protein
MNSRKDPVNAITFRRIGFRKRSSNKSIYKSGKLYGPISKLKARIRIKRPRGIGQRKYPIARARTFVNRQKPSASFKRDRNGR